MEQIIEDGRDLESIILKFSALRYSQNNLFCRGHLVVPGHECLQQSKKVVCISCPHLDPQVEAFQVGVIPGKLNFEVALRLICKNVLLLNPFFCTFV